MDKNLHLRKLADIKTRPAVCHSVRELVEILTKVVNEIPDDTFACELRNKAKFWYTSEELNDHSLSLAEALEAALAGKRVQHKTWDEGSYLRKIDASFVRVMVDGDNELRLEITTDMLTGWIVLDR